MSLIHLKKTVHKSHLFRDRTKVALNGFEEKEATHKSHSFGGQLDYTAKRVLIQLKRQLCLEILVALNGLDSLKSDNTNCVKCFFC